MPQHPSPSLIQGDRSPAVFDATEGLATIAWLLGWVLLVGAVIAAAAWLVAAIRDAIAGRRASIINAITFAATVAMGILAVIIAPMWGTGSAVA
jgi:hypothetical protein